MPQLVACPSCGCKVQAGETLLGRRTRCIACGNTFVASDAPVMPLAATDAPAVPVSDEPQTYPLQPDEQVDHDTRRDHWQRGQARHRLPLCPRCHRPVEWDTPACPHCSHLLDTDDRTGPPSWQRRRDGDDHRGPLIDSLGTICLLCAVMGLCTAGVGVVMAMCTGIPALVMAGKDLERMRNGDLDPDGAAATEMGRNKAIAGLVLAVVFGAVVVLVCIQTFLY